MKTREAGGAGVSGEDLMLIPRELHPSAGLIITTIPRDHADRLRSDELLAGEWSQR